MKAYHASIITTTNKIIPTQPANNQHFTLEELQKIVGGHIEIVSLASGQLMVLNEEGKLLYLAYNSIATELFNQGGRLWHDPIVGNVLVCSPQQLQDDDETDDETQVIDRASTPTHTGDVGDHYPAWFNAIWDEDDPLPKDVYKDDQ